ncbi:unnamed protein product, partial [Allacma fusca]
SQKRENAKPQFVTPPIKPSSSSGNDHGQFSSRVE